MELPAGHETLFDAGDRLHIRVIDQGPGLSEEALEKLFTDGGTSRKLNGTGLGLSSAKRALQSHGGDLRLAATGPQGTRFDIILAAANI